MLDQWQQHFLRHTAQAPFVALQARWQCLAPVTVTSAHGLRLGMALKKALPQVAVPAEVPSAARELLVEPPACRQGPHWLQKPPPAWNQLLQPPWLDKKLNTGQQVPSAFLVWGTAIEALPLFIQALTALDGVLPAPWPPSRLQGIDAVDSGGGCYALWTRQQGCGATHAAPRHDLGWWLQHRQLAPGDVRLRLQSPARLPQQQRLLQQPTPRDLAAFALRRVSRMLYVHCQLDLQLPLPPAELLAQVEALAGVKSHHWGWQQPPGLARGGVAGQTVLSLPPALMGLESLFFAASLLNVGKEAAIGWGLLDIAPAA